MSSKTKHVNIHFLNINRKYSRRLRCIYDQKNSVSMCHLTDSCNIHIISCKIGTIGTYYSFCLWRDRSFHIFQGKIPLLVCFYNRKLRASFFHLIEWSKHRVMLQHGCDHMISRFNQSFNRNIQTLCRIHCKHNLLRIFCPK